VLFLLFLLSGAAALLYQVVWQRTLFSIYGINIESVTMVVTAFMLGLGLGSLAGGALSKDPRRPVVLLFSAVEGGIGLYGIFSLAILHGVGEATLALAPSLVGLTTFALVLLPTTLMGSTLPLLVAHLTRTNKNVGRSVGSLYFVNTLGSAFASAAAVLVFLGWLGQSGTVRLAAMLNFSASAVAYVLHARAPRPSAEVAS
jgi:predicted membrane-bound spermidine synthase